MLLIQPTLKLLPLMLMLLELLLRNPKSLGADRELLVGWCCEKNLIRLRSTLQLAQQQVLFGISYQVIPRNKNMAKLNNTKSFCSKIFILHFFLSYKCNILLTPMPPILNNPVKIPNWRSIVAPNLFHFEFLT